MTLTTMSLSFIPSFYSRLTNKSIKCKTNKKEVILSLRLLLFQKPNKVSLYLDTMTIKIHLNLKNNYKTLHKRTRKEKRTERYKY